MGGAFLDGEVGGPAGCMPGVGEGRGAKLLREGGVFFFTEEGGSQ